MYVLIDTSERELIALSLFDTDAKHDARVEASNRDIVHELSVFLRTHDCDIEDVQGILVVVGEGSFTSTRLATTVANTFAYVQQIPVLAISKEQSQDPQALIPILQSQPAGQYISATYSAPPHIG